MKNNKRNFSNVSIQTKITGLVLFLILMIVGSVTTLVIILEYQKDIDTAEKIALQTAKTLSYMPAVRESFQGDSNREELRHVLDSIREDIGASSIILRDRNQMHLLDTENRTDPMPEKLQQEAAATAQMYGNNYVKTIGEGAGASLVGVSGIQIDYGSYYKVEGTVIVIYDMKTILADILIGAKKIIFISLIALLFGLMGSWILARDIRKDMFGLEPKQIASLYLERKAVFRSIREGLIVVDSNEEVTMVNPAAKNILEITERLKGKKLSEVINSKRVYQIIAGLQKDENVEIEYNGQMLIVGSLPVYQEEERVGSIYSLRDRTEIRKMTNTLTEVKQYSDDLRAQTHEFKNKLHVLFGLLQLGRTNDAMQFLNEESQQQQGTTEILNQSISDTKVQAILLGKIARASENRVDLHIDPESSLEPLPCHIELLPLLTILGNLIDNALDAVKGRDDGAVSIFATDFGNDIIFEITDNGPGIPETLLQKIFQKGYSLKGKERGYGLYNVAKEIENLGGEIEVESEPDTGTTFTVYLKKENAVLERKVEND